MTLPKKIVFSLLSFVLLGCGTMGQNQERAAADALRAERIARDATQGQQLLADGEPEAAVAFLESAVAANPEDVRSLYYLAEAQASLGLIISAKSNAFKAVEYSEEPFPSAMKLYVGLCLEQGMTNEAKNLLESRVEADPDNLTWVNLFHRILIAESNVAEVFRDARVVLKKDERNVGAMHNLALAYLVTKRPEQAAYVAKRALEVDPEEPETHVILASVYEQKNDPQKTLGHLEKAYALAPDTPSVQNSLAVMYLRLGDSGSAVDLLRVTVQRAPGFVAARVNLGNALRGQKEYEAAGAAYEEALKLNGKFADANYNLGILYLENEIGNLGELERYQRALRELEQYRALRGISSSDEDVDGLIRETKGLIKLALERKEEALKAEEDEEEEADEPEDDVEEDLEEVEKSGEDAESDAGEENIETPVDPELEDSDAEDGPGIE